MIYVVPILFLIIFVYCIIKNIPAYDFFVKGCSEAVNLVISIFPYLCAIFIFVTLMDVSGISDKLCILCEPLLSLVGIPKELSKLIILRPFSGNGSLAIVKDIFMKYGVDSYIGRCASVVVGASDTIFYVTAVYFSTTNVKKLRYTIPICIMASFCGSIASCFFVRIFS